MSALTVACWEGVWFPECIFSTATPFARRLVRVLKADITASSNQQTHGE